MVRSSSYKRAYYRGGHSQAGESSQVDSSEMFFGKRHDHPNPVRSTFFQTKLAVGQPNDAFEQEADRVADRVVSQKPGGPVVQQKEITSVQRLATDKEDEKLGTNDARMLRDKEIQEKPDVQRKCAECEKEEAAQRQPAPEEKDNRVQHKAMSPEAPEKDPEEVVQHKAISPAEDKDKLLQHKAIPPQEDKEMVQHKSEGASPSPATTLGSRMQNSAGKGSHLPQNTLAEMQTAFHADFSHVAIHNDTEAVDMNKALRAQAFTHGRDIYFNTGKYDPQSAAGKHLLAHELTHVIQQGAAEKMPTDGVIQPYREKTKGSFNYGTKDTSGLEESSFNKKKDKDKKPWIDKIFIHFHEAVVDKDGAWMPKGLLVALYKANSAMPIVPVLALTVAGGKHTEMFTHPGEHTVHRIEGVGYNNAVEPGNEGPNKRYVPASKGFDSNMSFAIFFHKGEALHRGALDIGSHGCVHIDWGGATDEGDVEVLRRMNYHSVIGLTKVIVSYDPSILPLLCCKLYAKKNKKKGTGESPCNKVKAQTCTP